jgi:hypothetical protein
MSRMRRRVEWTFFDAKITKDTKDTKGRFAPKPVGTPGQGWPARFARPSCASCFLVIFVLKWVGRLASLPPAYPRSRQPHNSREMFVPTSICCDEAFDLTK